jgi:hypothetical protein
MRIIKADSEEKNLSTGDDGSAIIALFQRWVWNARNNQTLLLITLLVAGIGLLACLAPVSDFQNDGFLDSPISEEFLLFPALLSLTGLLLLLTRQCHAFIPAPQQLSPLPVPPPIPTK